ncbi:MAG: Fe(2+)-trafficking protein [Acidobacteriota bacterium]
MIMVDCTRCDKETPAAENVTYGGKVGEEIRKNVCQTCWQEWQGMEVMVINELRLNFMDPKALETLIQHMREYFRLAKSEGTSALDGTPADVRQAQDSDAPSAE